MGKNMSIFIMKEVYLEWGENSVVHVDQFLLNPLFYYVHHEGVQTLRGEGLGLSRPLVSRQLHEPLQQHRIEADRKLVLLIPLPHLYHDPLLRITSKGVPQSLRGISHHQMVPVSRYMSSKSWYII